MKTNITISLDSEIVTKLKAEQNYSDLINEQMKGYYDVKMIENKEILEINLAKIKQNLKELRKKKRETDEMIAKIDKKNKKFKQFLRKKGLTRSKLIKQITERRAAERNNPHRRTEYFTTAEEEADSILKGGDQHDRL